MFEPNNSDDGYDAEDNDDDFMYGDDPDYDIDKVANAVTSLIRDEIMRTNRYDFDKHVPLRETDNMRDMDKKDYDGKPQYGIELTFPDGRTYAVKIERMESY